MKLKDFIGKVVICNANKYRLVIDKIDGVGIYAATEKPNSSGYPEHFLWKTEAAPNDNAIANGTLVFEDKSLTEPFKTAYREYLLGEGKYDSYFYYMSCYD